MMRVFQLFAAGMLVPFLITSGGGGRQDKIQEMIAQLILTNSMFVHLNQIATRQSSGSHLRLAFAKFCFQNDGLTYMALPGIFYTGT